MTWQHIVAISGSRASGKTSIASVLRERHGLEVRSFGDEVRREAAARGIEPTRENLRELGASLVAEWGFEKFCGRVVAGDGSVLVVEGVRHAEAVSALRRLAPLTLVFVNTSGAARATRLAARKGEDLSEAAERHSTEVEVPQLEALADLVVDGGSIESAADDVVGHVAQALQLGR